MGELAGQCFLTRTRGVDLEIHATAGLETGVTVLQPVDTGVAIGERRYDGPATMMRKVLARGI